MTTGTYLLVWWLMLATFAAIFTQAIRTGRLPSIWLESVAALSAVGILAAFFPIGLFIFFFRDESRSTLDLAGTWMSLAALATYFLAIFATTWRKTRRAALIALWSAVGFAGFGFACLASANV